LSLNPNGSKDLKLKIQDLPDITVRDYTTASKSNPIIISNRDAIDDTVEIQVQLGEEGIAMKEENPDDITINSSNNSNTQFDSDSDSDSDSGSGSSSNSDFDDDIDSDAEDGDCNMD